MAPKAFRYVEVGSILLCVAFDAALAMQVARGFLADAPSTLAIGAVVLGAFLTCDLVAGLVHFVGDSFGSIDTPVLGRTFVLPFRSHHVHPEEIRVHDFVETNGNNAFAALFAVVPTVVYGDASRGGGRLLAGVFVLVFTLLVLITNQLHKWAHQPEVPAPIRILQRLGIVLSPERHAAHHRPPYEGGYCVTSGVWNRLLDPIGFFPALERAIRFLLRLPPRNS